MTEEQRQQKLFEITSKKERDSANILRLAIKIIDEFEELSLRGRKNTLYLLRGMFKLRNLIYEYRDGNYEEDRLVPKIIKAAQRVAWEYYHLEYSEATQAFDLVPSVSELRMFLEEIKDD